MKNSKILEDRLMIMSEDYALEHRSKIERVVHQHLLCKQSLAQLYIILGQFGPEKIFEKGSRILQKLEAQSRETRFLPEPEEQELERRRGDYRLSEEVWDYFPYFYHPEGPQRQGYFPREREWHEWFEGGYPALDKRGYDEIPIAGQNGVTTLFVSQCLERERVTA